MKLDRCPRCQGEWNNPTPFIQTGGKRVCRDCQTAKWMQKDGEVEWLSYHDIFTSRDVLTFHFYRSPKKMLLF